LLDSPFASISKRLEVISAAVEGISLPDLGYYYEKKSDISLSPEEETIALLIFALSLRPLKVYT